MPTPAYAPVRNSEDDASPAAPGGGGGPPPNNPLLSYWREFQERTPYVTRTSLIAMAICYLVSFFFNAEVTLGNVPFFTVFSFEIYRVVTAPFVGNSFLTLVMVVLFYPAMGTKMEASVGSAAFLYLMAAMTVVINIVFLAVCFLLYAVGMVEALFYSCSSFWLVLFALIVIECMQAPEQPRRIFMLPMDIPSKYFPLLMYAVFSLLSGPALSFAVSMGVGYLYSWGHLDRFLKPAQGQLEAYEAEGGVLHAASRNPGWILASAAVGIEAWAAQQGSAPAGGGGLPSWTGGGASGGAGAGGGGEAGADARPSPVRTCILHMLRTQLHLPFFLDAIPFVLSLRKVLRDRAPSERGRLRGPVGSVHRGRLAQRGLFFRRLCRRVLLLVLVVGERPDGPRGHQRAPARSPRRRGRGRLGRPAGGARRGGRQDRPSTLAGEWCGAGGASGARSTRRVRRDRRRSRSSRSGPAAARHVGSGQRAHRGAASRGVGGERGRAERRQMRSERSDGRHDTVAAPFSPACTRVNS